MSCKEYYIANKPKCFIETEFNADKLITMETRRRKANMINRVQKEVKKITDEYEQRITTAVIEIMEGY